MTTDRYVPVGSAARPRVPARRTRRGPSVVLSVEVFVSGRSRGSASRAPLALALGAALAAPLAFTAPAASATDRYTVTPLTFTVRAGDRDCTVDADLYRPAGVDRAHPAPAVLATNGFGGS